MKVTAISIKDKTLSLTVESLTPEGRDDLAKKVKETKVQSAAGSSDSQTGAKDRADARPRNPAGAVSTFQ